MFNSLNKEKKIDIINQLEKDYKEVILKNCKKIQIEFKNSFEHVSRIEEKARNSLENQIHDLWLVINNLELLKNKIRKNNR